MERLVGLGDPGGGRVQYAELSGPRGPVQVYGVVMDAWWLDQSHARQQAVRELLAWVGAGQQEQVPLIVCGDFNADPDSDEIRMLTGRSAPRSPACPSMTPGRPPARAPPALPGPTATLRPRSCCGPIAEGLAAGPGLWVVQVIGHIGRVLSWTRTKGVAWPGAQWSHCDKQRTTQHE